MHQDRYLALVAGPFRIALPLVAVRQILDTGGADGASPEEAAGAISLAMVFGEAPMPWRPAVLRLDAPGAQLLVSSCKLEGVFTPQARLPLPETVAMRWPGLLQGALLRAADAPGAPPWVHLLVDPRVLSGVVEATVGAAP